MLNEAIDRIAGLEGPARDPEAVATELSANDVRSAAAIHVATLLAQEIEGMDEEWIRFAGLSVALRPSDRPEAAIRYDDVGRAFDVEGIERVRQDGPVRLGALLWLFHFARDRADGLTLLPPEMRRRRITEVAHEAGASERFVLHLLGHYDRLAARVSA